MQGVALLACIIIALQMAIILIRGDAFCLNQGCRIVEKLTTIPAFFFNLAGLVYFFVVLCFCRWYRGRSLPTFDWLRLLLLIGLTAEGVLVGYQIFVVQALCSYCLVIFSLIVLLNLLYGRQQLMTGVPLFFVVLAAFAVLNFGPALLTLQNQSLGTGTLAVKRCVEPAKKLYFFFSSDCPHCKNVLSVLENCNSCEFHFNPIDKNQVLAISGLEYNPSYSPSLNRVVLSMLNITTIPVLLVQNPDGLTFIKGEEGINRFVRQTCFLQEEEISIDPSLLNLSEPEMNIYDAQEGDCTIEVECPDEPGQTQGPDAQ